MLQHVDEKLSFHCCGCLNNRVLEYKFVKMLEAKVFGQHHFVKKRIRLGGRVELPLQQTNEDTSIWIRPFNRFRQYHCFRQIIGTNRSRNNHKLEPLLIE
ncbi:hypothetical protein D3C77_609000 [compost metagenome]